MGIKGLTKSTLIDYPGHTTATLFVGGCQFKCPFCHNGTLVTKPNSLPDLSRQELFSFLETRKGLVDSICITGGEPTLYKDLKRLIYDIKQMDFLVKLDTNGYEPYQLDQLLKENLVDYCRQDFCFIICNLRKMRLMYLCFLPKVVRYDTLIAFL